VNARIINRIANAIYRAVVAVGGRDKNKSEELADEVVKILSDKFTNSSIPNIEDIQDVVEKVLIEKGHASVAKEFILYREESAKRRGEEGRLTSKLNENVPWAKVWRNLDWAVEHNLHTVNSLNNRIANGEFPQIVNESERLYEDDVTLGAELIIERLKELRMVMISGPSSSGKTTTTIKLEKKLLRKGYKFKALNVDHYFFDLEMHPKDEFGDAFQEGTEIRKMIVAFMKSMYKTGSGVKHLRKQKTWTELTWETFERATGQKRPDWVKIPTYD